MHNTKTAPLLARSEPPGLSSNNGSWQYSRVRSIGQKRPRRFASLLALLAHRLDTGLCKMSALQILFTL
jgi:hypothetical protein